MSIEIVPVGQVGPKAFQVQAIGGDGVNYEWGHRLLNSEGIPVDIRIVTPPGAAPGVVVIEVEDPDGQIAEADFRFLANPPVILAVVPAVGALAGGTPVVVTLEEDLPVGSVVRFDGVEVEWEVA